MKKKVYIFVIFLIFQAVSDQLSCKYIWGRNEVTEMAVKGNDLWASTEAGVIHWNLKDSSFTHYSIADGLPVNSASHIAIDSSGRVWCASIDGAYVLMGTTWEKKYSISTNDKIRKIAVKSSDTIAIASRNEVVLYASDIVARFDTVASIPLKDIVFSVGFDHHKRLWISNLNSPSAILGTDGQWVTYGPSRHYSCSF